MSNHKTSHVLLEIICQDGTISSDFKEVLKKWHSGFLACFKGIKDDPNHVFDDSCLEQVTKLKSDYLLLEHYLKCIILIEGIENDINHQKKFKWST